VQIVRRARISNVAESWISHPAEPRKSRSALTQLRATSIQSSGLMRQPRRPTAYYSDEIRRRVAKYRRDQPSPPTHPDIVDLSSCEDESSLGNFCEERFNLEKADGTAKYANHAKAGRIGGEDQFSQRLNVLVHSTPFPFAYLACFAD